MEKVLLSAEQAAELSLNKGYEWFKNQVFKQIRETAERGESELHWGIANPFNIEWLKNENKDLHGEPSVYIENLRKIKSLLSDLGYYTRYVTCEDNNDNNVFVTELVIAWCNVKMSI